MALGSQLTYLTEVVPRRWGLAQRPMTRFLLAAGVHLGGCVWKVRKNPNRKLGVQNRQGGQEEGGRSSDWPLLLCLSCRAQDSACSPARPLPLADAVYWCTVVRRHSRFAYFTLRQKNTKLFANCHAITQRPINSLQLANIPSQFAIRFNMTPCV